MPRTQDKTMNINNRFCELYLTSNAKEVKILMDGFVNRKFKHIKLCNGKTILDYYVIIVYEGDKPTKSEVKSLLRKSGMKYEKEYDEILE